MMTIVYSEFVQITQKEEMPETGGACPSWPGEEDWSDPVESVDSEEAVPVEAELARARLRKRKAQAAPVVD